MLDGKCKEAFEKWYEHVFEVDDTIPLLSIEYDTLGFNDQPFEMQSGVYLAFFDSVGIFLKIHNRWVSPYSWGIEIGSIKKAGMPNKFETRTEALKEAIKQANKIYNEETNS